MSLRIPRADCGREKEKVQGTGAEAAWYLGAKLKCELEAQGLICQAFGKEVPGVWPRALLKCGQYGLCVTHLEAYLVYVSHQEKWLALFAVVWTKGLQ